MTRRADPERLHRLVKHAIDSGAANSVNEAEQMFRGYRLRIEIAPSAANSPVDQVALLTAVAVGRRAFLGGVRVVGDLDARLAVPLPLGRTLRDAVVALGGGVSGTRRSEPTILIGQGRADEREGFCIRAMAGGWRGGIAPIHADIAPAAGPPVPLAGMLAAALAVNEAYLFVSGGGSIAGYQTAGLSLWDPRVGCDWTAARGPEPELVRLPSKLWLIGLGHLGQAYLWGLGVLPYRSSSDVTLVLQDVDAVTKSTESTSVLTDGCIGQQKTRLMAEWAEQRGFKSRIIERMFDSDFTRREGDEPAVALCGIDNAEGRRALDSVGFDLVVEAGLGRGHQDFRTMCLHTLPGPRCASDIWRPSATRYEKNEDNVESRPAYRMLASEGSLDPCGIATLAGKAVGAPFVGVVAAALALSEILRPLHGGAAHQMMDLDLLSLDYRIASRHPRVFDGWNPGFTAAI